jgi:hypothetical protein
MHNGFEKSKTLIFDHLARRENSEEVDGIKDCPPEVLTCHEGYVEEIRRHMSATVEVVWGAPVRKSMKKFYDEKNCPLTELRLWGSYSGVSLFLEWSSPGETDVAEKRLLRVIVFVMHPQVFLHKWGAKYAACQGLKLFVAGKLAKVEDGPRVLPISGVDIQEQFCQISMLR